MSRRNFLRVGGGAACGGLLIWLLRPQPVVAGVAPPGALAADAFAAACLRCGRCAAICDQQAIGIGVDGLPAINGIGGWCDFCLDCIAVCPSAALRPVDADLAVLGTAVIDEERCIAWTRVGCRLCAEKCNRLRQAIWIDEELRPHVDATLCNGCGACVSVCPQPAARAGNRRHGKAVALLSAPIPGQTS